MNKQILGLVVLAAALAIADGPTKKTCTVLVVSLQSCVDECDEAVEKVKGLVQEEKKKSEELNEQVKVLKARMEELQAKKLSARDDKWYADFLELAMKKGEIEAVAGHFQATMSDTKARLLQGLILDAREVSETIRKERGAELVLMSKLGPIKFEDEKTLQDEYIFRRVLTVAPENDITKEVMVGMNAKYKDRK